MGYVTLRYDQKEWIINKKFGADEVARISKSDSTLQRLETQEWHT